jgi:hypothetical protein
MATYIDHPLTNGDPDAIVFVTQNRNPGGGPGTDNDHAIGMRYSTRSGKWTVFNQNLVDMPTGAAFNILVPSTDEGAYVHEAAPGTTTDHATYLLHPLTNSNSGAIMFVTQNWNPGGVGGIYNDHPIGVWYSIWVDRWAIVNEDVFDLPEGAAFNVLVPRVDTRVFVHSATADNTTDNNTYIDHPLTNGDPDAILFVTHNVNPGGGPVTYNDHEIGVWYATYEEKWGIFNQDQAPMPEGAYFNVLVASEGSHTFFHTTTVTNTAGNYTLIYHPLTDQNPCALLFVTQNWNPGGGAGGGVNDHPIGVRYFSGPQKWAIFHQDLAHMPAGIAFNVLVIVHRVYLPVVVRGT